MVEHIEHPEITWAMRTGYPSWLQEDEHEAIFCDECRCDITNTEIYHDEYHKYLCESCLLALHRLDY